METSPEQLTRIVEDVVKEYMVPFNEDRMQMEIEQAVYRACQYLVPDWERVEDRRKRLVIAGREFTYRRLRRAG